PCGPSRAEIWRAEGFMAFDQRDIAAADAATLQSYPVVLLAETSLTSTQANRFTSYVAGGGHLIAMRPDAKLATVFGVALAGGAQTDGSLAIDSAQGLATGRLQIHGPIDPYNLNGAIQVAQLFNSPAPPTSPPVP